LPDFIESEENTRETLHISIYLDL